MKKLEDLIEFCEKTKSFPYSRTKNKEERSLYWFSWKNKEDPRIIELKRKYAKRQRYKISLDDFVNYCKKHNKFPSQNIEEEKPYYYFYNNNRENLKLQELKKKYRKSSVSLGDVKRFCEKYKKLPNSRSKAGNREERKLYLYVLANKNNPEIKKLINKYKRHLITVEDIKEFCEVNNRFPSQYSGNTSEQSLYSFFKRNKDNETLKTLRKNYRLKTP